MLKIGKLKALKLSKIINLKIFLQPYLVILLISLSAVVTIVKDSYQKVKFEHILKDTHYAVGNGIDAYIYKKNEKTSSVSAKKITSDLTLTQIKASDVIGTFNSLKTSFKAQSLIFDNTSKTLEVFDLTKGNIHYLNHLKTDYLLIDLKSNSLFIPKQFEAYEKDLSIYLRGDKLYYDGKGLIKIN